MADKASLTRPVVVLAPLWRDSEVICRALGTAGMTCRAASNMEDAVAQLADEAGALLIAEEAVTPASRFLLLRALEGQPAWSDLPVVLLLATGEGRPRGLAEVQALLPSRNVTILRRPVPSSTLISVLQAALRARARQYEVREHLQARQRRAEELEQRVAERTQELRALSEELRAAYGLFYTFFHSNPLPVAITRLTDDRFIDVNDAYLRYFGYEREQVIGRTSRELDMWLPDAQRDKVLAGLQDKARVHNLVMETAFPPGESKTALASVEVISIDGTEAAISSFVDITARLQAEQQIRDLASQLTVAEHQERHRISQILHDDLQQQLYSVEIQLAFVRDETEDPELLRELEEMEKMLAMAISTTRQLSADLSPAILRDEGLGEAISWIAGQMRKRYGLEVALAAEGSFPVGDDGRRVVLFQIVRELLFNAVKHAGVGEATVTLRREGELYCIQVADKGVGFDPEVVFGKGQQVGGQGLHHARERLQLIGGRMEVDAAPGSGTTITIYAPADGERPPAA